MALHLRDRSEHAGPTLRTYRPTIIPGPRVRDGKNGERGTRTLRYRSPTGAVPLGVPTGYAKLGVTLGNHKAKTEQRPRADLIPGHTPTQRAGLGSLAPHRPLDASHLTSAPPLRLELRALVESDRRPYLDAVCASRQALDRWAPLHRTGESDDELFDRQIALARAGETHANAFRRVGWFEGRIAGGFNLSTITRGLQFEADVNWWVRSDLTRMGLERIQRKEPLFEKNIF